MQFNRCLVYDEVILNGFNSVTHDYIKSESRINLSIKDIYK